MLNQDWNQRYITGDIPWETGSHNEAMENLFKQYVAKGTHVLELACGVGTNAEFLAKTGYEVTAIDLSVEAIRLAQASAQEKNLTIEYRQLDFLKEITKLSTYDVIFDCAFFHILDEVSIRQQFVERLYQLCKPNALWISIACSKDDAEKISRETGVSSPPVRSLVDVISVIEPKFEVLEVRKCEFKVHRANEGKAKFKAWAGVYRTR